MTPASKPTATPVATPTAVVSVRPTGSLNGVPISSIVLMPDAVRENIRSIYERGQALGRNPRAFSKVGDSTMVWPPFLTVFADVRGYALGPYADLQTTISYYAGSFGRESIAVLAGMHTWTEFDATWTKSTQCKAGETPLVCELRVHNPSVAVIRLGTNDALEPAAYEQNMRRIIEYCLANGIIPALGSKPDRVEGPANTINQITLRLAETYKIPFWDYDLIAETVPGKGLQADGMHYIAGGPRDYRSAATYGFADSLEDLTGLMLLDTIRSVVQ
jgi:hypothetical protein